MLGHNNPDREKQRQVAMDSVGGFATTLAAMLAMLGAPYLNELTSGYVVNLARQSYAPEIVDLVEIAWLVACFPFVFFAARASVGVALMVAGSALAYRFLDSQAPERRMEMAKYVDEKIGEIRRIRKVKTFGDKLKEFLQGLVGVAVFLIIIGLIVG